MITAFAPLAGFAASQMEDDVKDGTLSIYFENDLFTGTDRFYTNGVKVGWTSADLEKFADSPYASGLLPLIARIPYINSPNFQKNLAFSIGQNIYTPDDTEATQRLENDRPYAGWLYLGLGFVWKNAEVRNSLVLNVGVVGSWSYAEETQRLVHEARGAGLGISAARRGCLGKRLDLRESRRRIPRWAQSAG